MNNGTVLGLRFREGEGRGQRYPGLSSAGYEWLRNPTGRPWIWIKVLFSLEMSGSEVKPLTVKASSAPIIHCNRCALPV